MRKLSIQVRKFANKVLNKTSILFPKVLFIHLRWWFSDMDYPLNLRAPKTYNEKLQWLKVYNKDPKYTILVDKYQVKGYVDSILGHGHTIPTLGVWEHFDDIDFNSLPNQFVLKTTHDSGTVIICHDKSSFDYKAARELINKRLGINYYRIYREWPYKNVKPRIIAEKYMVDESEFELKDYKFFCFDGTPKIMFIASNRFTKGKETAFDFYDMKGNYLKIESGHQTSTVKKIIPDCFVEMQEIAARLSKGIPHVRIDLYEINRKIYFGEYTFFHWSGLTPFNPPKWDEILGNYITLPNNKQNL